MSIKPKKPKKPKKLTKTKKLKNSKKTPATKMKKEVEVGDRGGYLVIVESPTKAKTISSILGKEYDVTSSMGHVIDLPANKLSVDVDNGFEPVYQVISGKEKIIAQLKKKSKGKKAIYLATDSDREGEAISWHIKRALDSKNNIFYRVVFHEITEEAIREAFKKCSHLDMHKVNAQIARRVLDRIVGYRLSPILWKRIVRGLSAGRVQSIALKFIVEREKEIVAFISKTTFSLEARFRVGSNVFKAKLTKCKGSKGIFENRDDAQKYLEQIKSQEFIVKDLIKKETKRKPPPPFITSSLQQDAFNRLRLSAGRTMMVAQKLYEGAQILEKSVGLITYMRTDSFHISDKAKKEAKEFVRENYGQDYLSSHEYHHKQKKGAQLAHEAIRPSSSYRQPDQMKEFIVDDEARLYELIWKRFVAGFMKEAVLESSKAKITSEDVEFEVKGLRVLFEGFLKVLGDGGDDNLLPPLEKGQTVILEDLIIIEHTTKAPARYNDASLVKLLEEKGVGRPSTYAPIIYTLFRRNYARREKRAFLPTVLGIKVSDLLVNYFPKIMDENFTASIEEKLDEVENGNVDWRKVLEEFYPDFNKKVEETLLLVKKEVEYSDKTCPQCKGRMVIKWSRRGRFLSCENFPRCRYAESITTGVPCPDCKVGQLIERRNRRGQNFYGCSKYPECTYTNRSLPEDQDNNDQEDAKEED
ncbi:MAG: type I DNA topoisomerase [Candidatus Omnitrophica bacterium]|nr:type I DNA topoisomerase [Candidatus Omnitrophota bacterium]